MKKPIILLVLSSLATAGVIGLLILHPPKAKPHRVTLTWHAPAPVPGVTISGYNVYRSTSSGGPYVRIATGVRGLTFDDRIVNSGRMYFYVVTSVDQSGRESRYSVEISAQIP